MKTKFTNSIVDILLSSKANRAIFNMWGATDPVQMGDGVKFCVTKSPFIDYVYIRYLSGYDLFDVEFAALVGTEYDVIDRISPVSSADLTKVISKKVFNFNIAESN